MLIPSNFRSYLYSINLTPNVGAHPVSFIYFNQDFRSDMVIHYPQQVELLQVEIAPQLNMMSYEQPLVIDEMKREMNRQTDDTFYDIYDSIALPR